MIHSVLLLVLLNVFQMGVPSNGTSLDRDKSHGSSEDVANVKIVKRKLKNKI